jgi:hypothetical protein
LISRLALLPRPASEIGMSVLLKELCSSRSLVGAGRPLRWSLAIWRLHQSCVRSVRPRKRAAASRCANNKPMPNACK